MSKRPQNFDILSRMMTHPDPADRDAIGFSTRVLCQSALPSREPVGVELWQKRNGPGSISITPWVSRDEETGEIHKRFPYGAIPRLTMIYLATEAVKSQSREVMLGDCVLDFLKAIGYTKQTWNYRRVEDQLNRLFRCSIRFYSDTSRHSAMQDGSVISRHSVWWDSESKPEQPELLHSKVLLSEQFFEDLQKHAFPVDLDIVHALHKNVMALDYYQWISHTLFSVNRRDRPLALPWSMLYCLMANGSSGKHFREDTRETIKTIQGYWPGLRISFESLGLTIYPSPLTVKERPFRPLIG
jgi:hypothetical protein